MAFLSTTDFLLQSQLEPDLQYSGAAAALPPLFPHHHHPDHSHNHNPHHDFYNLSLPPPLKSYDQDFNTKETELEDEEDQEIWDEEGSSGGGGGGHKKNMIRRLKVEQVKALEKSFEVGNKLEPERKMQLARALGLQPRQIAIWFQNRRARWKTKKLERDYDVLKKKLETLKADNDAFITQNNKLKAQLLAIKGRESTRMEMGPNINLNIETTQEGSYSCLSTNNTNTNTNTDQDSYDHLNTSKNMINIFHNSSSTAHHDIQRQRFHHNLVNHDHQEAALCSMLSVGGAVDVVDQTTASYWSWSDHPQQPPYHHQSNLFGSSEEI